MARLLHRTHLLCLLSRGLLFDQAASDALLQVTGCCHMGTIMHLHHYAFVMLLLFQILHIANCVPARHNPLQGLTTVRKQKVVRVVRQIISSMGFPLALSYAHDFAKIGLLTH